MSSRLTSVWWGALAALACFWPSTLLAPLDGVPLDGRLETLGLGLVFPILWWLAPRFLGRRLVRGLILGLLAWKLATAFVLTQGGWCARFFTDAPTIWGTPGRQQSWDFRTGWLYRLSRCSAVIDRPYATLDDFPAWFLNLFNEDGRPPEASITMEVEGFLTAPSRGTLSLHLSDETAVRGTVGPVTVDSRTPGSLDVVLDPGVHRVQLATTLTGSSWRFVPRWSGRTLWNAVLTTVGPPSRLDQLVWSLRWITPLVVACLLLWWIGAAYRTLRPNPALIGWMVTASVVLAAIGWDPTPWSLSEKADRFAVLLLFGCLAVPIIQPLRNLRGAFLLLGIPWLSFLVARSFVQIGRLTLYALGNDWLTFQRYAGRIFMEGRWLEGGDKAFWYQPLYRWIVGALHLVFGDSSVGEVYWDGIGLTIGALFSFYVVKGMAGFRFGLCAGAATLATFALGPIWYLIGRGLSEISAAACAYLAGFWLLRARLGKASAALMAGLFAVLAFYTRLNHLPFLMALAALTLPLTLPAETWLRLRALLRRVPLRVVALYGGCLMIGVALFALRTWYYTGVLSVFHGTQGGYVSLLAGPASLLSPEALGRIFESVAMVITVHDPPRLNPLHDPRGVLVMGGVICALLALCRVPRLRRLPLALCLVCLGAVVFALFVRGAAYPGRFSVHLVPAARAVSIGVFSLLLGRFKQPLREWPLRR